MKNLLCTLIVILGIINGYSQENEPWVLQTKSDYIYYSKEINYNIKKEDRFCKIIANDGTKFAMDYMMFVTNLPKQVYAYSGYSSLWVDLIKGSKTKVSYARLNFPLAASALCHETMNIVSGSITLNLDKALNIGKGKEFMATVEANFKMEFKDAGYTIKINNFKYKYNKTKMGVTSSTSGKEEIDLEEIYKNFLSNSTNKELKGFFTAINLMIMDIINYPEPYLKKIVDLYYL
jgi:hypothetical protein